VRSTIWILFWTHEPKHKLHIRFFIFFFYFYYSIMFMSDITLVFWEFDAKYCFLILKQKRNRNGHCFFTVVTFRKLFIRGMIGKKQFISLFLPKNSINHFYKIFPINNHKTVYQKSNNLIPTDYNNLNKTHASPWKSLKLWKMADKKNFWSLFY
jgi:hypothetical protein